MIDPTTLDDLEALLLNSSRLPWMLLDGWGPDGDGLMHVARIGPRDEWPHGIRALDTDTVGTRADLELAAKAVNALPELLAAAREAERLREALEKIATGEADIVPAPDCPAGCATHRTGHSGLTRFARAALSGGAK